MWPLANCLPTPKSECPPEGRSIRCVCEFLFFYFCLHWVSIAALGLPLVVASGGLLSRYGAWASHYGGSSCFSSMGSQAQAQQLWGTGLVAPQHMESSRTGDRTRVPCIGSWILNHWTTREAPVCVYVRSEGSDVYSVSSPLPYIQSMFKKL